MVGEAGWSGKGSAGLAGWTGFAGRAALALLSMTATTATAAAQQGPAEDLAPSSRLAEWVSVLASADPADSAATARFWTAVRETGTPLVDPDPTEAGYSLVTFVARGGDEVERMRIDSNLTALLADGTFSLPDDLGWMHRLENTDAWVLSFRLRNDLRVPYRVVTYRRGQEPESAVDPLNGDVWEPGVDALRSSVLELPDAPPQPWRNPSGEEGKGDWDELSADDGSGRKVYVYKPIAWRPDSSDAYPVLVGLDAFGHGIGMRVDRMVDTLIESGRLPPMVVALVDLAGTDEETRYAATATFVLEEFFPYLRDKYGVTGDAHRVVVSGTSRRGMVASLLALEHPETFGNVLSLSGSYYWSPEGVAPEWVPHRYAAEAPRPVRFYLAAGELETFVSPGNRGHYLLATNRHMHDVLVARGYDVEYVEYNGVHSELNWQDGLAAGLVSLLGTDEAEDENE